MRKRRAKRPTRPAPPGGAQRATIAPVTAEQLRLLIEHTPAAIAMLDRDLRYLMVSRRWLDDYRLTDRDVVGRSHYELFPEIPERWKEIHRRCLAGAVQSSEADPFQRQDGSTDVVRWEVRPWYDGAEVGGLIIFSEVITARVRAEQALRESALRIETMVRSGNIGLWDWDVAADRGYFSPECKRQVGYEDYQVASGVAEWARRVHPEDAQALQAGARAFLEKPVGHYQAEYRLRHKDGSWRWVLLIASALPGPDGRPARLLGSQVDITARKRAEFERREMFERVADAFVAVDRDWNCTYANSRVLDLLQRQPGQMIGRNLWAEFPEGLGGPFHRAWHEAMRTQQPVTVNEHSAALGCWIEARAYPSTTGLSIYLRDSTEDHVRTQELQDSRERFRGIVASAMDAIVSVDEHQRIVLFNHAAETMFGYTAASVMGQPLELLIPESLRATHADDVRAFDATGVTTRTVGALGAVRGRRADGAEVPLEGSISQIRVGGHPVYTAILRDLSQRLRTRQQLQESAEHLRQLSRRLVEAQELEQRRISTELHDRIGQSLTALDLNLESIATLGPPGDARVAERLADSRGLLQSTIAAVRGLISEIRPVALEDYGLLAGLRDLAKEFSSRTGAVALVDGTDPAPRPARAVELGLYRIAQEALTNVTKHARARRVSIQLQPAGNGLELSIEDDGRGFDQASPRPGTTRHWGLLMMQERAEAAGAVLEVRSTPGSGTRIVVRTTPDRRAAARPA